MGDKSTVIRGVYRFGTIPKFVSVQEEMADRQTQMYIVVGTKYYDIPTTVSYASRAVGKRNSKNQERQTIQFWAIYFQITRNKKKMCFETQKTT